MQEKRWQKIEQIFGAAVLLDESGREKFVRQACSDDEEITNEILSLLTEDGRHDHFLENSVFPICAKLLTESDIQDLLTKKNFGSYKIEKLLGRGGMGAVFLAEDLRLNRLVALKILPNALGHDNQSVLRFQQEARAASGVAHPNIAHIYEFGYCDGRYFLAMEYVRGKTLRKLIKDKAINENDSIDIALQIASALNSAHKSGIVHRDVKPENIIVQDDKLVKVLDFGIAKLNENNQLRFLSTLETVDGQIIGTTAYMSPEQVRGQALDASTDVWSLAVVLFEMLAGIRPFDGETPSDVQAAILTKDVPSLPKNLKHQHKLTKIIKKALKKSCIERYQTASEFINELSLLEYKTDQNVLSQQTAPTKKININEFLWKAFIPIILASCAVAIAAFQPQSFRSLFGYQKTVVTENIKTLSIIPFRNSTGDKQLDLLSEGVAEDLIRNIGSLNAVQVTAYSSSRRLREEQNFKEFASRLNAGAVLRGNIERDGNDLIVSVEVISTETGSYLWQDRIQASNNDLLKLRNALSSVISNNLQTLFETKKRLVLSDYSTRNEAAYRLYLEGKYGIKRITAEDTRRAINYFEQAIAQDSNYALANVELAVAYNLLGTWFGNNPEENQAKAKQFAEKALTLDEDSSEAHTILAKIKMDDERDFTGAESQFRRAIEINPNNELAHHWYGEVFLSAMGRFDESIKELEIARQLNPLSHGILTGLAWSYIGKKEYEKAIEFCRKANELVQNDAGNYSYIAMAEIARGNCEGAVNAGKTVEKLNGISFELGAAYGMCGQREEARQILQKLEIKAQNEKNVSDYNLAVVHAALGEKDRAFELLEKNAATKSVDLLSIRVDPLLDNLRDDPRFAALERQLNLPQY